MTRVTYARLNPYSRVVFLMKVIIPVVAFGLFSFVMIFPNLSRIKVQINVPRLDKENDISFSIHEGRISGQGAKGETFEVTASDFRENNKESTMLFSDISGRVVRPDDSWMDISGRDGLYDKNLKKFLLTGNVEVNDGDDVKIQTDKAEVDIGANTVTGDLPVKASTPFGFVTGASYKFIKDDAYKFFGRVEGRINSDKLEAATRKKK